jgi:tetratricopeptide (TPR) repeat protein
VRLLALALFLACTPLAAGAFDEGVRLAEAGRNAEARTFFTTAAAAHPHSPIPPFWLGRLALNEEDWDEAIESFEKAVALEDGNSTYHMWLGRAIGSKAQRASVLKQPFLAKKVKAQFERAVELDGSNLEARSDLISYYLRAPAVMGGSVEKAEAEVAAIAALDPFRGHLERARIYEHEKKDDLYERELLAASATKPDEPGPRFQLGFLHQRLERWDAAFRTFDELAKNDKVKRNALFQVGRTGALSGRNLEHAAKSLEAYLAGPPGPGEPPAVAAHFRLAQVYEKLGRVPQARTELETTLRLDPKHAEAKKALDKLKSGRG